MDADSLKKSFWLLTGMNVATKMVLEKRLLYEMANLGDIRGLIVKGFACVLKFELIRANWMIYVTVRQIWIERIVTELGGILSHSTICVFKICVLLH